MSTIILTGGGTAGHCTPNLALIPFLKNAFDNIYYVGSHNGIEKDICNKEGIAYYGIDCAKLKRKITLDNLKIPFKVIRGIKQCDNLIANLKPDVVFSKGGYVSIPLVLSAHKNNVPILSHESDITIGLANKICSKYCTKVFTSFSDTAKKLKNGEHVGSPLRSSIFLKTDKNKTLNEFNFNNNLPILLVLGGSQGSSVINQTLRNGLNELLKDFQILHIVGKGNIDTSINIRGYTQIEYLDHIEKAFNICDVCISRAGSNSAFELLAKKIPTLLIPLPKGLSRGDQVLNAEFFLKKGMVFVLQQENLTVASLITSIKSTYNSKDTLVENINANSIKDASRTIALELNSYATKNNSSLNS